jgi:RNA ligase
MLIHPARTMSFDDLMSGLEEARANGFIFSRFDKETGRVIYCYTNKCVYDKGWNQFSLISRGLILHPESKTVVATPFPKFFNAKENGLPIPNLAFETFEKLDGSLAIIHHHADKWRVATKGAFQSPQAIWSESRLSNQDVSPLTPGTTYLAEAIYPDNQIVIHYPISALVLLAAYREDGTELDYTELQSLAQTLGWRVAKRYTYTSFADLVNDAEKLPVTQEGFVIRFIDGTRLKIKGNEYRRIHAIISRCTPLAIWEAMNAEDDLENMRRNLPEEFLEDFDQIVAILSQKLENLMQDIDKTYASLAHLGNAELHAALSTQPEHVRPFLFPWKKTGRTLNKSTRANLFRVIRPTGNVLEGYVPSFAMHRVIEEDS